MRKIIIITGAIFVFFLIEFFLFNFIGRWIVPNFALLLVVFFNLYWGIRYGLFTAVLAGTLQDSFSTNPFGVNLFTLVVCVYATTFLKQYIYHVGSSTARFLLLSIVCIISIIVQCFLHVMLGIVDIRQTFQYVLIPETLTTLIIATYIFERLKKCVLKLYV
ncbi:MAG: rod shape-determining protein MreD [Candidatus Zapsychrus exili]|nr:rod shape-determining protein MreD [Candidatus Zapsychrus exili]